MELGWFKWVWKPWAAQAEVKGHSHADMLGWEEFGEQTHGADMGEVAVCDAKCLIYRGLCHLIEIQGVWTCLRYW